MTKAEKAIRSAKMELEDAANGYCCSGLGAFVQRNSSKQDVRQEHPKGYDHKRHQRRLKSLAKRLHSKAHRRLAREQLRESL